MSDSGSAGHSRRRSVDVGGLALALGNQGLGHGWGGWEEREKGEIRYAELLSEMYMQTQSTVNSHHVHIPPIDIPSDIRQRLIASLDSWNFEPHKLPDEEVLCCTMLLFEVLFRIEGMDNDIGIPLSRLSGFLRHLRTIYRWQNSYHNFQHALDVLQATQMFLCAGGRVPPVSILLQGDERTWRPDKIAGNDLLLSCMDNLDVFALYIAAIGHDVGHPGFSNVFMKNAQTPLSVIYDDKSALEQMHYALLLQIMRHNGLGDLLDRPQSGIRVRKLLSAVVLATDMSVHFEFMRNFGLLVDGAHSLPADRTTLVCQALIKCADISNPSRPHGVSQHWASALSEEWMSQMQLEEHFHLPSTVKPSMNPLGEARSQIFFITNFAKPLLDLTARAIPQLIRFAQQCTSNLKTWETRASEIIAVSADTSPDAPNPLFTPCRLIADFSTAFPMTLPYLFAGECTEPPSASSEVFPEILPLCSDAHPRALSPIPSASPICITGSSALPSPADSVESSLLTPRSEQFLAYSHQRPSSAASGNSSNGTNDANAAIRAAYHAGPRKKKSLNRNSWHPLGFTAPVPAAPPIPPQLQDLGVIVVSEIAHGPVPVPAPALSLDAS